MAPITWPFLLLIQITTSTLLLAFSSLCDGTTLYTDEHCTFIRWVIQDVFRLSLESVVSFIADNCELNMSISRILEIPLVGCASHRFNLAANLLLSGHKPIFAKISSLLGKFRNLQ